MNQLGVTMFAFLCLVASVAAGAVVHARHGAWVVTGRSPALRATVAGMLVLATIVLGHAVIGLRGASADVDARLAAFSGEVARLDRALRHAGEDGQPARELLFRYVDRTSREVFPRPDLGMVPDSGTTAATVRQQLRAEVERIAARGSAGAAGQDIRPALESFLKACASLGAMRQPTSSPWLEAVLLTWTMLGLATLGALAGPRRTGMVALIALAAGLSVGIYFVEEMAFPLQRVMLASASHLEDVLHIISD